MAEWRPCEAPHNLVVARAEGACCGERSRSPNATAAEACCVSISSDWAFTASRFTRHRARVVGAVFDVCTQDGT